METEYLKTFFNENELPTSPISVNKYMTITNCKRFVESHINIIESNNKESIKSLHYERLIMFVNFMNHLKKSKEVKDESTPLDNQHSLF